MANLGGGMVKYVICKGVELEQGEFVTNWAILSSFIGTNLTPNFLGLPMIHAMKLSRRMKRLVGASGGRKDGKASIKM